MWIIFSVLLVLWFLSIHFYLPVALTFIFFAAMLAIAAVATLKTDSRIR